MGHNGDSQSATEDLRRDCSFLDGKKGVVAPLNDQQIWGGKAVCIWLDRAFRLLPGGCVWHLLPHLPHP